MLGSVHMERGTQGSGLVHSSSVWVNVLMNQVRAAYQNQSGFQLITAVGTRSGFSPLCCSLVAEGHRGQEKIHSDLHP